MSHGSPRMRRISSEVARSIFANLETGGSPSQGNIDYATLIYSGFNCKGSTVRVELHSQVVSIKAILLFVKAIIIQRV